MMYSIHEPTATLRLSGERLLTFLHGQCTADVLKHLKPHSSLPTALCQYQGKTLAFGHLQHYQDSILLHLPYDLIDFISQTLTPYAKLDSITLSHTSNITTCGIISDQPLMQLDSANTCAQQNPELTCICLATTPFLYLLAGSSHMIDDWLDCHDLTPCMQDAWDSACIQAHIPCLNKSTSGLFTPNMLSLVPSRSVSLQKGCYLGQEIIARTHHLGKVKKTMATYFCKDHEGDLPIAATVLKDTHNPNTQGLCVHAAHFESTLWLQMVIPTHTSNFIPQLQTCASTMQPLVERHLHTDNNPPSNHIDS